MSSPLRFAVIGTGFWSNFQIPAWKEFPGTELVAVYNRTRPRAEEIARKFDVPAVYSNVEEMLDKEKPDFVDIITDVDTHPHFTKLAAARGVNVICQKPMAPSLAEAESMLEYCEERRVKLFVHENFRWQAPIRTLKKLLGSDTIGEPFKARVTFCSAFPVFENQPFLANLEQFILTDVGSHVLDICRFLFGEVNSLYCTTQRVNTGIRGEDVANVLMQMKSGLSCYAEMSYASILEKETFPQTLILVEGSKGSIQLAHDFEIRVTTKSGTAKENVSPTQYSWADPAYALVHSSIVDCNRNILEGLLSGSAENTGADNLRTIQLVYACYDSAAKGRAVSVS
ncbi:MAG TPA: Gfo/Idh/MocA family oxidoreductase [Chryseolinea sp.]|nr:Gfo/Idh/MocA family oxidoreductase [Chryseolinea sp.]